MDILDDMDDPEKATGGITSSSNFGGPGEYMMMDTDDTDSATPELPRRTEESKHLMGDAKEPTEDSLYCEPAPVWSSSPSSECVVLYIISY